MRIIFELQLKIDHSNKIIYFGTPDSDEEMYEMYKLRYLVYSSRNYIDASLFPDGLEKDEYDIENKCAYFIAKIDNRIIGSVRLIRDEYLPTEKDCFRFEEPDLIKNIPRNKRGEIGRLVIIPYNKEQNQYLPRGITMLSLIHCLAKFGIENEIFGGYAFIKQKLEIKLEKLKIPFHRIQSYTQIYHQNGLLFKYFNDSNDKVIPIYFIRNEIENFIGDIFNHKQMFERVNDNKFILRDSLYNQFLKFLKII